LVFTGSLDKGDVARVEVDRVMSLAKAGPGQSAGFGAGYSLLTER
jgi:hypothetical protein